MKSHIGFLNRIVVATCLLFTGCYAAMSAKPTFDSASLLREKTSPHTSDDVKIAVHEISAKKAVEMVLARNADLRAFQARVEALDAQIGAAGRWNDLELRVGRMRLNEAIDGEPLVEVALRVRPDRPGQLASRADEARLEREEQAARLESAKLDMSRRVRELHAKLRLSEEAHAVALAEETLRAEGEQFIAKQVQSEAATKLDLALATLDRAEVADSAQRLEVQRVRTHAILRGLLEFPPDAVIAIKGFPGGVADHRESQDLPALEELILEAMEGRAERRVVGARRAQAEVQLWRAESEKWPWFSFLQVETEIETRYTPTAWGFGLGIDLPVFSWTGNMVAAGEANVMRGREEERAMVSAITREVESAYVAVRATAARLLKVENELLPAAKKAQELAERANMLSAFDHVRDLRLKVSRLRAQRRYLDAKHDYVLARIVLDHVLGKSIQ